MGHGSSGIESRSFVKRVNGLFMVEGIHQPEALIEILLSLVGGGRDGMMQRAEIAIQRNRLTSIAGGGRMDLSRIASHPDCGTQQASAKDSACSGRALCHEILIRR